MALPEEIKINRKESKIFDTLTLRDIYSTVDFFLINDQKNIDKLWNTLLRGYAAWTHERKNKPLEEAYRTRPKLFVSPDDSKKPWEYDDYRANSPIKLLNHLWSLGHFREPNLIYGLKAFAIVISITENNPLWKDQILSEVLLLRSLENEVYKLGNKNYREVRLSQTKGLKQNDGLRQLFLDNERRELNKQIHSLATEYLNTNKCKRDIGNLIFKSGIVGIDGKILSRRSIGRYLVTHPSGLWIKKPRK